MDEYYRFSVFGETAENRLFVGFYLKKFKFMLRAEDTRFWYAPRLTPLSYAPVVSARPGLNTITPEDPKVASRLITPLNLRVTRYAPKTTDQSYAGI